MVITVISRRPPARRGQLAADLVQPLLQRHPVERGHRQRHEDLDAVVEISRRPCGTPDRSSPSLPTKAAGSSTPQCALIGWPGQTGQTSAAALSQTVNTKSSTGAPGAVNSSQLFERRPLGLEVEVLQQLQRHRVDPAGRLAAGGEGPETALAPAVQGALGHDAAGRVAGAQEQDVEDFARPSRSSPGHSSQPQAATASIRPPQISGWPLQQSAVRKARRRRRPS